MKGGLSEKRGTTDANKEEEKALLQHGEKKKYEEKIGEQTR